MGATTFVITASGESADAAFRAAVAAALHRNGHGGYTGTIAEKSRFVMIPCPPGVDARKHACALIDRHDRRIDDKWGPAGCIDLGSGEFLFFGWASE